MSVVKKGTLLLRPYKLLIADAVVAESVVVIKRLLQTLIDKPEKDEEHESTMKDVISHLSKLLDSIDAAKARASIIWVIGEYSHKVPKLAPDILRKLAKTFPAEDPSVKLQILNLGTKLYLTNAEQTQKIFDYVLTLAKYDINYDVRDRCRLMRKILFTAPHLREKAMRLFINKKPIPTEINPSSGRERFILGSLSHALVRTANGYEPLPDFPEQAPDRSVRNEVIPEPVAKEEEPWPGEEDEESYTSSYTSEGEEGEEGEESFTSDEEGEEEEEYTDEEEEEGESEEEEEEEEEYKQPTKKQEPPKKQQAPPAKQPAPAAKKSQPAKKSEPPAAQPKTLPTLDDLFNFEPSSTTQSPAVSKKSELEDLFGPVNNNNVTSLSPSISLLSSDTPKQVLLKHVLSGGLSIEYSYSRTPSMHGATVNTIQLYMQNVGDKPISNIRVSKLGEGQGWTIIPFPEIASLAPGATAEPQLSIKFGSVSQAVKFEISTDKGSFPVSITPSVGDLVRASSIPLDEFTELQKKLTGMNEASDTVTLKDPMTDTLTLTQRVLNCAYLSTTNVDYNNYKFKFAGRTMLEDVPLLVSIDVDKDTGKTKCSVCSENTILNPMLLKELKKAILNESSN